MSGMTLYDFLKSLRDKDKMRLYVDGGADNNVLFDGKAEEVPMKYLDRIILGIEIGAVYKEDAIEDVNGPEIEVMLVD